MEGCNIFFAWSLLLAFSFQEAFHSSWVLWGKGEITPAIELMQCNVRICCSYKSSQGVPCFVLQCFLLLLLNIVFCAVEYELNWQKGICDTNLPFMQLKLLEHPQIYTVASQGLQSCNMNVLIYTHTFTYLFIQFIWPPFPIDDSGYNSF